MNDQLVGQILGALVNRDDGSGLGGSDGALWLIIILFMFYGNGFNNRGGGGGGGNAGGDALFPWMNQSDQINNGLMSITQLINSLATQLCNCCGDIQMALANGFANIESGANARQMASMNQLFGMQTAVMQGFAGQQLQTSQLASDIQLGNERQTATILAENCADRAAISDGVRDIMAGQISNGQRQIDNQNMWGQRIVDTLMQFRMEDKDEKIADLRQQVYMKDLAASQLAQDARIVNGVYTRLMECPVGTMPVCGNQPIFTCQRQQQCPCNG